MNSQASLENRSEPRRVLECLDSLLKYRLALLVAPAGSGKTACLKQWAARWCENGQGVIAWMNLCEEDNAPGFFLIHLENTVGRSACGVGPAASKDDPLEDGIAGLINHLAGAPQVFTLVLDDYQTIHSPLIHEAVQLLLDYLPPQVRVIIASRSVPPLALPRLRVRRQLLELGSEDL